MSQTPWTATMIASDDDFAGAPLLRKDFSLPKGHGDIVSAKLRATALGIFEAFINGQPVTDEVLSPGWSSYEWRLRYGSYDVTPLLQAENTLGVSLGNGWYRGFLGFNGGSRFYGEELGFLGQLDIEFADGFVHTVASDSSWRAGPSATLANDLYNGQTIDARLIDDDWARPGFAGSSWTGTHVLDFDVNRLADPVSPPVTRQEELTPVNVFSSPTGKTLLDFGQNLVGWIKLTVQGPAGTTITVRHAEVLEDSELGTRLLRTAEATDRFILSGGRDVFEPTKTFHGFRYAEIDGWPGELTTDSAAGAVDAVVVHTKLQRTGHFESSNELVNQLHRNVVWGLRGNFLDVPTDCPQRNERLGWTGDIAVFAPTAAFLFDVKDFLQDWLLDLAAEQKAQNGLVPFTVPDILKYDVHPEHFPAPESTALWSEAAVWVPWALWEAYGDPSVLKLQFDSMAAHTRRVEGLLSESGLWDTGFQFGDWLDPDAPPENPIAAKADKGVVATACMYHTAILTAKAAAIVGRPADAEHFQALADRVKQAFNTHYVDGDGIIHSDSTTVYALAISFDVLDSPEKVAAAGTRLSQLVRANGYRVSTGFAGTPYITGALSDTGHIEDAYGLLLEEECPSWLYPVKMGATTVWERWDSMLPDGTINPGEMTSFNHYALGAVADWLHKVVGGLSPLEPGYAKVRIAPRPGPGLTSASVSLQSPHGVVAVEWHLDEDGNLQVQATVPDGVTADVDLPGLDSVTVGSGTHAFTGPAAEAELLEAAPSSRTEA
ncbi:alpha-L-rhamnosidase [Arthrobacter sp. HY1533]|uniref:alpha-L-rhamnosidase n=1 Tax=Arthrobacter sp. HY1533 TaxID=2970919 RepID=UPI0022B9DE5B|nr:alpha-L-rhamnosidase [Arthrobacter sp. HY1533]